MRHLPACIRIKDQTPRAPRAEVICDRRSVDIDGSVHHNQNLLDLCCCVFIVVCLSVRVGNVYVTGTLGYVICAMIISEAVANCLLNASVINLLSITFERYLKVVWPFWSKKYLKRWIIIGAIVFSWIAGLLSMSPMAFATTLVVDGSCLLFELYWQNAELMLGYSSSLFFFLFLFICISSNL